MESGTIFASRVLQRCYFSGSAQQSGPKADIDFFEKSQSTSSINIMAAAQTHPESWLQNVIARNKMEPEAWLICHLTPCLLREVKERQIKLSAQN